MSVVTNPGTESRCRSPRSTARRSALSLIGQGRADRAPIALTVAVAKD